MDKSFPEYFHENFYSHMILYRESDKKYTMSPPNQQDWNFKIKKLSDTRWYVKGHKEQDYIREDYNEIFEFKNGKWNMLS